MTFFVERGNGPEVGSLLVGLIRRPVPEGKPFPVSFYNTKKLK
jgi:hypothetical protein